MQEIKIDLTFFQGNPKKSRKEDYWNISGILQKSSKRVLK